MRRFLGSRGSGKINALSANPMTREIREESMPVSSRILRAEDARAVDSSQFVLIEPLNGAASVCPSMTISPFNGLMFEETIFRTSFALDVNVGDPTGNISDPLESTS